jgi:hypothetical protein
VHARTSIGASSGGITDRIIGCDQNVPTSNHVTFIYDEPHTHTTEGKYQKGKLSLLSCAYKCFTDVPGISMEK